MFHHRQKDTHNTWKYTQTLSEISATVLCCRKLTRKEGEICTKLDCKTQTTNTSINTHHYFELRRYVRAYFSISSKFLQKYFYQILSNTFSSNCCVDGCLLIIHAHVTRSHAADEINGTIDPLGLHCAVQRCTTSDNVKTCAWLSHLKRVGYACTLSTSFEKAVLIYSTEVRELQDTT